MKRILPLMPRSVLTLSAPAKINLWLRVTGKRDDGYHEVETRLCPISLEDEISLSKRTDKAVKLSCSDATVPTNESNLVLRSLRAFESATGTRSGWDIHLEKHIPHGAGLGGGSSDAAAMLRGLNDLGGSPLGQQELSDLAATIGSDVPFFLHETVCDATGRGEKVQPVEFPWRLPLVLIKPSFNIPTPWAYQGWAESRELPGTLYAPQLCEWGNMVNDLERPVFEKWTLLPTLKTWLLDQPETHAALMSGSGSTMFAIARSGADAAALAERAKVFCGETTWVQVAETL